VQRAGSDLGQGYLYSHALTAEAVVALLPTVPDLVAMPRTAPDEVASR
jgi:sensor c-di-GMP phosphodiesterase-like protein